MKKRILAIGPHPDDVELGCFGALCKYAQAGHEIHILTLTRGEGGTDGGDRAAEARASAALIPGCALEVENLRDRYVSEGPETIAVIEKHVKRINPDLVFIPSLNDTHQDHRAVHRAAVVAARLVKQVLVYQSPSATTDFRPNFFVDVTPFIETKMQAARIHSSQGGKVYMAERAVKGLAEYRAFDIFLNDRFVEAFETLKYLED